VQGKLIQIAMKKTNNPGDFYIGVKADIDSKSRALRINLVNSSGKNSCGELGNDTLYGCTFIPPSHPASVGNGWEIYCINVDQMIQTAWGKDIKNTALEYFVILPNLNLAYIEITNSNSC